MIVKLTPPSSMHKAEHYPEGGALCRCGRWEIALERTPVIDPVVAFMTGDLGGATKHTCACFATTAVVRYDSARFPARGWWCVGWGMNE